MTEEYYLCVQENAVEAEAEEGPVRAQEGAQRLQHLREGEVSVAQGI